MKHIDSRRIYALNRAGDTVGPVVYWMSREQRVRDNWGLLHARFAAGESRQLAVVFCLMKSYPGAALRHYDFMLRGLEEVESSLAELGIPFLLRTGNPESEIPALAGEIGAGLIVTDFDPLRIKRQWQGRIAKQLEISLLEVDGHNVVPARFVSDKREYAARTFRPKVQKLLPEFLTDFPDLLPMRGESLPIARTDWGAARDYIDVDRGVGPVSLVPGESAARNRLEGFISKQLSYYAEQRNDPNADAVSGLSPYFHFGQLAPQRAAFEVAHSGVGMNQEAYLEELVVRRELSDNFCLHSPAYDSLEAAPEWALKTLGECTGDSRSYVYSQDEFERAATHSALWNAAQNQLLRSGSMHGYMRMYWAKKVLEWSASPEAALDTVNMLNDRYALDGRDPNGYVGALWSIAGLHDRPWKKRPVFGSVRYMNEKGCRRKFDVDRYIERWGA
ncbi:deoxyribodipyrimidine photo-lyase [Maridesulfovibrio sp.]|uniref:deoxyribodipyrimidine photo-lyase n=1 Tax=Maridesulfovibrio sp. TaxID=2795000 RepID=UPI002A187C97|nr:deoxyribodipyrimidine photo-lyase [Maridesulfovibrio sp.]